MTQEPMIALSLPLSAANVVLEGLMQLPLGRAHAVYGLVHGETSRQVEAFKAAQRPQPADPAPVTARPFDNGTTDGRLAE